MNEASVYLLKQNNDTKEIFSNNFFLSTFQSYHLFRENDPSSEFDLGGGMEEEWELSVYRF